jgi:hypothetical protein
MRDVTSKNGSFAKMGRVAKNPLLTIRHLWHIRGVCGEARQGSEKVVGTSEIARQRATQGEPAKLTPCRSEPNSAAPNWKPDDVVRRKGRGVTFRRDVGRGEQVEIALAGRIYRVRLSQLR